MFNELFDLLAGGLLESVGSTEVDGIGPDQFGIKLVLEVSLKKLEANRRNAQRSTGPKTEAGKKRSRYNAYKHGIFSWHALESYGFGSEDGDQFRGLLNMLREDREPVGVLEEVLVDRIAVCIWRLKRALQYENGAMKLRYLNQELQMDLRGKSDSDIKSLTQYYLHLRLPERREMDRLIRYETTIQRQLAFALSQLERLQRSRKGEQVEAPVSVQISTDQ